MFRKFLRFSFIPTSFFFWFLYSYATLKNGSITNLSLVLLIALLGIYTYPIFKFLFKKFNLKVKARWFFYYFLVSLVVILVLENVPFLNKFEYSDLLGLFAFLLLASCGISFILSLYFCIKTFFDKKFIHKVKIFQKLRPKIGKRITTLFFPIAILMVISSSIGWAYFISGQNKNSSKLQTAIESPTPTISEPTPTVTPLPKKAPVYVQPTPTNSPIPIVTLQPKPAFDWSSYRASRIKDLKGALRITNESIAYFEKEKAKYAQYSADAVTLYQSGQRTTEEFNKVVESLDKADALIESNLQELYRDREKYASLIKRFENGENISSAEEKAIRGI